MFGIRKIKAAESRVMQPAVIKTTQVQTMPSCRRPPTLLRQSLISLLIALQIMQPIYNTALAGEAVVRLVPSTAGVTVDQAPNGVPLVNIAAPNAAGLSHNRYEHFNVGPSGLLLNNSAVPVHTQLGGYIVGNTHLSGASARLILNEVTSTAPSLLNGYLEVAGPQAEVIVANPNGITCRGCGFINTPQATLGTGTPFFADDGALGGFTVENGYLRIEGTGLNAGNLERLALYGRVLRINAALYAQQLDVVAGANRIEVDAGAVTGAITPLGTPTTLSRYGLDSSTMGGMYANTIRLVGTEAGVGMRLAGPVAALTGDLDISNNGDVRLARVSAPLDVSVDANGHLWLMNRITGGGVVDLQAAKHMTLMHQAQLTSGAATTLFANSLHTASGSAIGAYGDLIINAGQQQYEGSVGSAGGLTINGDVITNTGQWTTAQNLTIHADDLLNAGGITVLGDRLDMSLGGTFDNSGGVVRHGGDAFSLYADRFINGSAGNITVAAGALLLDVSGLFDNSDGVLLHGGDLFNINAGVLNNSAGALVSAGAVNVQLRGVSLGGEAVPAAVLDNSAGLLQGNAALTLRAAGENPLNVSNAGGQVLSNGDISMDLAGGAFDNGAFDNSAVDNGELPDIAGLIKTIASLTLEDVGAFDNSQGSVQVGQGFVLHADSLTNEAGVINVAQGVLDIALTGIFDNSNGVLIVGGNDFLLRADTLRNQAGRIDVAQGRASLTLDGLFDNSAGLVRHGGDAFTLNAAALNNSGGVLASAGTLAVQLPVLPFDGLFDGTTTPDDILDHILAAALNNSGGLLQGNAALIIDATSLNNAAGQLRSNGAIDVDLSGGVVLNGTFNQGDLNNSAGLIATIGSITLAHLGALQNSGGLLLAGNGFSLDADTLQNQAGQIEVALGALQIDLTGAFDNVGGLLIHNGDVLNVNADTLNNSGGQLAGAGAVTIRLGNDGLPAAALNNSDGVLQGNAALTITAAGLNNAGGLLLGNGLIDVNLLGADLNNSAGLIQTLDGIAFDQIGIFANAQGAVRAGNGFTLNADVANNQAGTLEIAAGAVNIVLTDDFDNRTGLIIHGGDAAFNLYADALINSHGFLVSDGAFLLQQNADAAGPILENTVGVLQGIGGMSIAGHGVNNAGGQLFSNGLMAMDLAGADLNNGVFDNGFLADGTADIRTGLIQTAGGITLIDVGLFDNAGSNVRAGNGFSLDATAADNSGGRIEIADGAVNIALTGAFDNQGGTLLRSGSGAFDLHADAVWNQSGYIGIQNGAVNITLDSIFDNREGVFLHEGDGAVTLKTDALDNREGFWITGDDFVLEQNAGPAVSLLNNRLGLLQANGDLSLTGRDVDNTGGQLLSNGFLTMDLIGGALLNGAVYIPPLPDGTRRGSRRGLIQAIGGMTLNNIGLLHNVQGDLRSGGAFTLNADTLKNGHTGRIEIADGAVNIALTGVFDNSDKDFLRRGGTFLYGGTGEINLTTDRLDNQHGVFVSAGSLDLQQNTDSFGVVLENRGGVFQVNDLFITGSALNNSNGILVGTGAVTLQLNGTGAPGPMLDNSGGVLQGNTRLAINSIGLNNVGGYLLSGTADADGNVLSTGVIDLNLGTGALDNSSNGVIQTMGNISIDSVGMNNVDGTMLGNGNIDLNLGAGALDNSNNGRIQATGDIIIDAGLGVNNSGVGLSAVSGGIFSNGIVNLNLGTGTLNNSGGFLQGGTTINVTGLGLNNTGGKIFSNGIFNEAGDLLSPGALNFNLASGALDNSNNGLIQTTGDITLYAGLGVNNAGLLVENDTAAGIFSDGVVTLNMGAGTLNNSGGFLQGSTAINVVGGGLNNAGGNLFSGTTDDVGNVLRRGSIDLNLGNGTLDNRNNGFIQSTGGMTINHVGNLYNSTGTLFAVDDLTLYLPTFDRAGMGGTYTAGGLLGIHTTSDILMSGDTFVTAGGLWLDAGNGNITIDSRIEAGGDSRLTGAVINVGDAGLLAAQGALTVQANTLNNWGLIYGRDALTFLIEDTLNNGEKDIYRAATLLSGGDITISTLADGRLTALNNYGGKIETLGGDITIRAQQVNNINIGWQTALPTADDLRTETLAPVYSDDCPTDPACAGMTHAWDVMYDGAFHYWYVPGADNIAPLLFESGFFWNRDSLAFENIMLYRTDTTITHRDVIDPGHAASILADAGGDVLKGNITLDLGTGTLDNDRSRISAAGTLDIKAGQILNTATALHDSSLAVRQTRWKACPSDGACWPAYGPTVSTPSEFDSRLDQIIVSVLEGKAVNLNGTAIVNKDDGAIGEVIYDSTAVKADETAPDAPMPPVDAALVDAVSGTADGVAAAGLLSSADTTPVELSPLGGGQDMPLSEVDVAATDLLGEATTVVAASDPARSDAASPDAAADVTPVDDAAVVSVEKPDVLILTPALPDLNLPANGIFRLNTDPTHPYLIETDPLLSTYGAFLGSEYLINHLDWAPGTTQTRLGDGYYELTMIRELLLASIGSRFIDPAITDERAQFDFMMQNGIAAWKALQLSPGIALSAAQIDALQTDIIWLEEKVVAGQKVLVPVVYLAQNSVRVLTSGAVIGGNSVEITGGTLVNSGLVRAQESLFVDLTGNLNNLGGTFAAVGDLTVLSDGGIFNTSGTFSGANVEMDAAGDIVHRTWSAVSSYGTDSNGSWTTQVGDIATVTATGKLTQIAGNNILLTGASLFGNDVSLTAGNDVLISTVQSDSGYNVSNGSSQQSGATTTQLSTQILSLTNLLIDAERDITAIGAILGANEDIVLYAGGNVSLLAAAEREYSTSSGTKDKWYGSKSTSSTSETITAVGTIISAGGDFRINAERIGSDAIAINGEATGDVLLQGATITAGGESLIYAAGKLTLGTAQTSTNSSSSSNTNYDGWVDTVAGAAAVLAPGEAALIGGLTGGLSLASGGGSAAGNVTHVGTTIASVGDTTLLSGGDMELISADLSQNNFTARAGMSGPGSLTITGVANDTSTSSASRDTQYAIDGSSTGVTVGSRTQSGNSNVTGTWVGTGIYSRGDVSLSAATDINVIGSAVKTPGNIFFDVGRDINLLTGEGSSTQSNSYRESTVGVSWESTSESTSVFAGAIDTQTGTTTTTTSANGSFLQGENIALNAGHDIRFEAATVDAKNDIFLDAKHDIVVLDAADKAATDAFREQVRTGLEASVSQNVTRAVNSLESIVNDPAESRLANGLRAVDAVLALSDPISASVGLVLNIERSESHSQSSTAIISQINAGHDISMTAGNDVVLRGAQVKAGNDITFDVGRHLVIESAQSTSGSSSENDSAQLNVDLLGTGAPVSVNASQNSQTQNSVTNLNAFVYAGNKLTIKSGGDTVIAGAWVTGATLDVDVGGDLIIASRQDTSHVNGSGWNAGFGSTVSVGASDTEGDRAWVTQQSGLFAREGAADITVVGTTNIQGGILGSAQQDGLTLNTGALVFSDIVDHESLRTQSFNVGTATGVQPDADAGIRQQDGVVNGELVNTSGSLTYSDIDIAQINRATITSGTITVGGVVLADNDTQLVGLNRDISKAQEIIRNDSTNVDVYLSDTSLGAVAHPITAADQIVAEVATGAHKLVLLGKTLVETVDAGASPTSADAERKVISVFEVLPIYFKTAAVLDATRQYIAANPDQAGLLEALASGNTEGLKDKQDEINRYKAYLLDVLGGNDIAVLLVGTLDSLGAAGAFDPASGVYVDVIGNAGISNGSDLADLMAHEFAHAAAQGTDNANNETYADLFGDAAAAGWKIGAWQHGVTATAISPFRYNPIADQALLDANEATLAFNLADHGDAFVYRELRNPEIARITLLAAGDADAQRRLYIASCALVHCSAQYAVGSAEYEEAKRLEELGASPEFAAERQLLAEQTMSARGSVDILFDYTTTGIISDASVDALLSLTDEYQLDVRAGGALQVAAAIGTVAASGPLVLGGGAACAPSAGGGCLVAAAGVVGLGWSAEQWTAGWSSLISGEFTTTYVGAGVADALGLSPAEGEMLWGLAGFAPVAAEAVLFNAAARATYLQSDAAVPTFSVGDDVGGYGFRLTDDFQLDTTWSSILDDVDNGQPVFGWVGDYSAGAGLDGYVVTFMGKNAPNYYSSTTSTFGGSGGTVWVAPIEDVAWVSSRADVVTASGHAPGPLSSYLTGQPMYGLAVPTQGLSLRLPTQADAGANAHFRIGGITGVEHNGIWTSSEVREFVLPGGVSVPNGGVFFKVNEDGSWMPIQRW